MLKVEGSKLWLINFYREQLSKFYKLGMGKRTENNVLITERLINVTENRLEKLSVVYDSNISKSHREFLKRKGEVSNGQSSSNNGAIVKTREQSNGSSRHGRIRRAYVRSKEKR